MKKSKVYREIEKISKTVTDDTTWEEFMSGVDDVMTEISYEFMRSTADYIWLIVFEPSFYEKMSSGRLTPGQYMNGVMRIQRQSVEEMNQMIFNEIADRVKREFAESVAKEMELLAKLDRILQQPVPHSVQSIEDIQMWASGELGIEPEKIDVVDLTPEGKGHIPKSTSKMDA